MRKLLILALACITIQVTAQQQKQKDGKQRMEKFSNLTPEEAATKQTEKMTSTLDLTEVQQEKVHAIALENAKDRKATMEAHKALKETGSFQKLSDEEKLKLKNARLAKKEVMKEQMKEVLSEEQYTIWSENMGKRQEKMKHKMKSKKYKDSKKVKSE